MARVTKIRAPVSTFGRHARVQGTGIPAAVVRRRSLQLVRQRDDAADDRPLAVVLMHRADEGSVDLQRVADEGLSDVVNQAGAPELLRRRGTS